MTLPSEILPCAVLNHAKPLCQLWFVFTIHSSLLGRHAGAVWSLYLRNNGRKLRLWVPFSATLFHRTPTPGRFNSLNLFPSPSLPPSSNSSLFYNKIVNCTELSLSYGLSRTRGQGLFKFRSSSNSAGRVGKLPPSASWLSHCRIGKHLYPSYFRCI